MRWLHPNFRGCALSYPTHHAILLHKCRRRVFVTDFPFRGIFEDLTELGDGGRQDGSPQLLDVNQLVLTKVGA